MLSVPLSLAGAFVAMWALGYTLNTLSLVALVLCIGFVVDDAIVVIENIVRHMEKGEQPAGGLAQGRARNRLHRDLDHVVAGGGVRAAAVRQQHAGDAAARVLGDADCRGGDLGDRLADPDAGAVRTAAQARVGTRRGRAAASKERWSASTVPCSSVTSARSTGPCTIVESCAGSRCCC